MKRHIIQNNLSMFKGAPLESFRKAEILRKNMTEAEMILWDVLKNRKFNNLKFRRQHPIQLFIVDFYCHQLGLVIEIDGEYHQFEQQIKYDESRTEILQEFGILVIRYSNDSILNNLDNVLLELNEIVQKLFRDK